MKSNVLFLGGLVFLLVGLLAIAGKLEQQSTVKDQSQYCQMVKEGNWPDYKATFEKECR